MSDADPVAFATARLDEDWQEAHAPRYPDLLAARIRREVTAGRRILARHRDCGFGAVTTRYCGVHAWNGAAGCRDFRDLLVRWADHPDYDPLWSPE